MLQGDCLQVAEIHSRHPPDSRSPHSHAPQELKGDLLDETVCPVVMQWFNEDHWHPLNRSSFKNTALTTGHDLSDH